eukprot:2900945-Pyramimonas_sp.AAC.1
MAAQPRRRHLKPGQGLKPREGREKPSRAVRAPRSKQPRALLADGLAGRDDKDSRNRMLVGRARQRQASNGS